MAGPKVSKKKPEVAEGACIFCRSPEDNPEKLGKKYEKDGLSVHYFCMLFASGLSQKGRTDREGILGFLLTDIRREAKRSSRLKCVFCKEAFATIGCVVGRCREQFHFPCGLANGVLNQYFGTFCSFCEEHRPRQLVPSTGRLSFKGTAKAVCSICMSAVQARASNTTLKAPCCGNSWFHRECIQRMATCSGIHFFKCPLCNSIDLFQNEMLEFGIYIPDQDAAWEQEPNAYHELLERHSRCDVEKCGCNHGRNYNKDGSKWEIMLCDWCGSAGTHLTCSKLKTAMDDWVCKDCLDAAGKPASKSGKKVKKTMIAQADGPSKTSPKGPKEWLVRKTKVENKPDVPLRKRKADDNGGRPVKKRRKLASSTVTLGQLSDPSVSSIATHSVESRKQLLLSITPLKVNSSTVNVKYRKNLTSSSSSSICGKKHLYQRQLGSQFSTITSPVLSSRPRSESRYLMQKPDINLDVAAQLPNSRDLQNLLNQDIFTGRNLGDKLKDIYLPPETGTSRRSPNMPILFPEPSSRPRSHSRQLQHIPKIEIEEPALSPLKKDQQSLVQDPMADNLLDETVIYDYKHYPETNSPATRGRHRSQSKVLVNSPLVYAESEGSPFTGLEPAKDTKRGRAMVSSNHDESLLNGLGMQEEELARPLDLLPLPDDCLNSPQPTQDDIPPVTMSTPIPQGTESGCLSQLSGTPHGPDTPKSDSSLTRARKPIQFPDINDEKLPRWARRLLDDDVIQGKNLGEKFVKQYQPAAQVGQPKYTNHMWKLLPFKKRPIAGSDADRAPRKAARRRDRNRLGSTANMANENCPSPDSLTDSAADAGLNQEDCGTLLKCDSPNLGQMPFEGSPRSEKWRNSSLRTGLVAQRSPRSEKWARSPLSHKAEKSPLGHCGGIDSKPEPWAEHRNLSAICSAGQSSECSLIADNPYTTTTSEIHHQVSPRARNQAYYSPSPSGPRPQESTFTGRTQDTSCSPARASLPSDTGVHFPSTRARSQDPCTQGSDINSPFSLNPQSTDTHSPATRSKRLRANTELYQHSPSPARTRLPRSPRGSTPDTNRSQHKAGPKDTVNATDPSSGKKAVNKLGLRKKRKKRGPNGQKPQRNVAPKLTYQQFISQYYPTSSNDGLANRLTKLVKYQEYVSGDLYFTEPGSVTVGSTDAQAASSSQGSDPIDCTGAQTALSLAITAPVITSMISTSNLSKTLSSTVSNVAETDEPLCLPALPALIPLTSSTLSNSQPAAHVSGVMPAPVLVTKASTPVGPSKAQGSQLPSNPLSVTAGPTVRPAASVSAAQRSGSVSPPRHPVSQCPTTNLPATGGINKQNSQPQLVVIRGSKENPTSNCGGNKPISNMPSYNVNNQTTTAPKSRSPSRKPPVSFDREGLSGRSGVVSRSTPGRGTAINAASVALEIVSQHRAKDVNNSLSARENAGKNVSESRVTSPSSMISRFVNSFPRIRARSNQSPPVNSVTPLQNTTSAQVDITTSSGSLQIWNQLQTNKSTPAGIVRRCSTSPSSDDSFVSAKTSVSPTPQAVCIGKKKQSAAPPWTLKIQNVFSLSKNAIFPDQATVIPEDHLHQTSSTSNSSTFSQKKGGITANVSRASPEFISLDEYEEQTRSGPPTAYVSQSGPCSGAVSQSGLSNGAVSQSGLSNDPVGQSGQLSGAVSLSGLSNEAVSQSRPSTGVARPTGTVIPATVTIDDDEGEDSDVEIVSSSVPPKREIICKCGKKHYVPIRNKPLDQTHVAPPEAQASTNPEFVDLTVLEDMDIARNSQLLAQGAPQGSLGAPQGSHGAHQGSYGAHHSGHGAYQGSHGPPQSSHGAHHSSLGAHQGSHGAPQGRHGAPQGSHGAPQGSHGAPQGRLGAHHSSHGPLHSSLDGPRGGMVAETIGMGSPANVKVA